MPNNDRAARKPLAQGVAAARMAEPRTALIHAAIACVQRLSDLYLVRRAQLAASAGVTEQQWEVLEKIATEHFMPSMFARERRSSAAAISKTLRQLLARGLISVAVGLDDGRRRAYTLTADGRKVMARLKAERQRAIESIWRPLDPVELRRFERFAAVLADRMERYAGERGRRGARTLDARTA